MRGDRAVREKRPTRWFRATDLPLTGSGKIQKYCLREGIDQAQLDELPG
ncbi:hypothetical protein SNL152K_601 [Streptomyces sp. NL15-2K]|nr:hypothetical protein SNL152K_601 [Streptomyces sp. NL15-2K]